MLLSGSRYTLYLCIVNANFFPCWFEMYQALVNCFMLTKFMQY